MANASKSNRPGEVHDKHFPSPVHLLQYVPVHQCRLQKRNLYQSRDLIGPFLQSKFVLPERSEEHTSELQSRFDLVCRLLLEKKKSKNHKSHVHIEYKL